MKKFIFLIVFSTLFLECEKINAPNCIENKIDEIISTGGWDPPAKVYQYDYHGEKVYFFPSHCCDMPSALYNEYCEVLCLPDGGFSGSGDGKCPDFFSTRTNEKLIWEQ